jgi:hypothetical protein
MYLLDHTVGKTWWSRLLLSFVHGGEIEMEQRAQPNVFDRGRFGDFYFASSRNFDIQFR